MAENLTFGMHRVSIDIERQAAELEERVYAAAARAPPGMSQANALRAAQRFCGPEWEWEVVEGIGGDAVFHIIRYIGPKSC